MSCEILMCILPFLDSSHLLPPPTLPPSLIPSTFSHFPSLLPRPLLCAQQTAQTMVTFLIWSAPPHTMLPFYTRPGPSFYSTHIMGMFRACVVHVSWMCCMCMCALYMCRGCVVHVSWMCFACVGDVCACVMDVLCMCRGCVCMCRGCVVHVSWMCVRVCVL